jgi:hypothetical protein
MRRSAQGLGSSPFDTKTTRKGYPAWYPLQLYTVGQTAAFRVSGTGIGAASSRLTLWADAVLFGRSRSHCASFRISSHALFTSGPLRTTPIPVE